MQSTFPRDNKILGWCAAGPILTSWWEGASLALVGHPSTDGFTKKVLYRVYVSHRPAPHPIFPYWVGQNWIWLYCSTSWDWLKEMNAGGSRDYCWCLSFFGFLRPYMSPWGHDSSCFLVVLYRLMVGRPNLEVATKRLLHQQVEIPA